MTPAVSQPKRGATKEQTNPAERVHAALARPTVDGCLEALARDVGLVGSELAKELAACTVTMLEESRRSCCPKLLARAMRAARKLPKQPRDDVLYAIETYTSRHLDSLSLTTVAILCFESCKQGRRDATFLKRVAVRASSEADDGSPWDMANLVYVFATVFGNRPPRAVLVYACRSCRAWVTRLSDFKPIDLSSIAAGLCRLYEETPLDGEVLEWFERAASRVVREWREFVHIDPSSIAHFAWGLCRAKVSCSKLVGQSLMAGIGEDGRLVGRLHEGALCMALQSMGSRDDNESNLRAAVANADSFSARLLEHLADIAPNLSGRGLACAAYFLCYVRVPLATNPKRMLVGVLSTNAARVIVDCACSFRNFKCAELAYLAEFVALAPPSLLPNKAGALGRLCGSFASRAADSPSLGASRDSVAIARAVALVGDDVDFVRTVWKACVNTSLDTLGVLDLCMLDQARISFEDDPSFEPPSPAFLRAIEEAASHRRVSPSCSQADLSAQLNDMGWSHDFEYFIPGSLISLDLAQPSTKTAVEYHGPYHYFKSPGNPPLMNGTSHWKLRLLEDRGWTVLVVPYFDVDVPRILDDLREAGARFDPSP